MFRSTANSRAENITGLWARNRKLKTCACGGEKKAHNVTCPRCWFAAPEPLRHAWKQAVASKDETLIHEVAVKLNNIALSRKPSANSPKL